MVELFHQDQKTQDRQSSKGNQLKSCMDSILSLILKEMMCRNF